MTVTTGTQPRGRFCWLKTAERILPTSSCCDNLTGRENADGLAGSALEQNGLMNDANSVKTCRYDRFDRFVKYMDGDTAADYEYNTDNFRTTKTVNVSRTEYVWDGTNLMHESGKISD